MTDPRPLDRALPPGTSQSQPPPSPSHPPHSSSGERRPRTGVTGARAARRPPTARPDTSASAIGDLPDQQFFPEGEDFDEEDDFDDDEPEEDVFAFERPKTGAVPRGGFSDGYTTSTTDSPPNSSGYDHHPTTAGTGVTGVTGITGASGQTHQSLGTHFSHGTFGGQQQAGPSGLRGDAEQHRRPSSVLPGPPELLEPTGNMDAGGRIHELHYDVDNPPPFSGRENLNNSSFAFMNQLYQEKKQAKEAARTAAQEAKSSGSHAGSHRPPTGRSLLQKLQRRAIGTATTDGSMGTDTTSMSTVEHSGADLARTMSDLSSGDNKSDDGGTYTTELTSSHGHRLNSKRTRSAAPLIPSTAGTMTDMTSESGYTATTQSSAPRRGMSRGSYGMTEISGEMTVPDGKTTWGDGGALKEVSEGGSGEPEYDLAEEDSPYPEVRASVSNIDDPEMPALTLRAFMLGIFFTVLSSGINTFFHFRNPAPYISPFMIQIVVYPVGKALAWIMPIRSWYLPSWLGSYELTFNPGPFNIKEHTCIVVMANAAIAPTYALYPIVSAELWYKHDFGIGFNLLYTLSCQITGFSFAGLCRRFVIWPASMIWPGILVVATNLNTLHAEDESFQGGMTRFRFLMITGGAAFAWYFLPGFLFTALSYFSFACWIAPRNNIVNQLFGVSTGLGMGLITFDWSQINWIGSPLTAPWWAQVNIAIGFLLFYWIVTPILYYCNVWYTAHLPINVVQAADRFGSAYDIFQILTPEIDLNTTAYALYSPIYLSATFSMTFMLAFALATGLIVHTALHHGPRIYRAILNVRTEADDIHMKLMRQYAEVPDWWYAALFLVCFTFAVVAIEVYDTGLPVWGYLVAILLSLIYFIPAAFIYAMTSQLIAINLMAELIPGFIFKGRPIPGMIAKSFSVQTLTEGLVFVQDQKLGHYMKIPPRSLFIAQLSATAICSFVQIGVKKLLFAVVDDMCSYKQKDLLMCANTKVFFTSSIIWGLIGPSRLFSKGAMYYPQVWAALGGALLPIPLWLWMRKYPRSVLRNVNVPVIFNGGNAMPPANGVNYSSFLIVGFIFQFWIRRRHFAWWSKYNYVLSAALDVGTALSALFIFLVLRLPGANISWWGNTVYTATADWGGVGATYKDTPVTGFGPDTWPI